MIFSNLKGESLSTPAQDFRFRTSNIPQISAYEIRKNQKNLALKSGLALKRHTESAHSGKFREDCPACVELESKLGGK